jgi:hypothetical protein
MDLVHPAMNLFLSFLYESFHQTQKLKASRARMFELCWNPSDHPKPQEVARMSLSLAAGCCVFSEEFGFGTIHAVHHSGNTSNITYEVRTLFELFCAEAYSFSCRWHSSSSYPPAR